MDNKVRSILTICPDAFNATEEFYIKRMEEFRKEYSESYIREFEKEFKILLSDSAYSFKSVCEELTFFANDIKKSESEIRKYLTDFFTKTKYIN